MIKSVRRRNKADIIRKSRRYTVIDNGPNLFHYFPMGTIVRKEPDGAFVDDDVIPLRQYMEPHHYM